MEREPFDRMEGRDGQRASASRHSGPRTSEEGQAYSCPMHPEVRSDRPGRCPHCGMFLVPVEGGAQ